jgi:hypothetical protein
MRIQERFSLFQVIAHCRMSDSPADESLNRGVILLGEFVFEHLPALHHEHDSFEFADVFERVARDSDQAGGFTGLDAAGAILPTRQLTRTPI